MDESHPVCAKIKAALSAQILRLYRQRGVTNFYTGGAIGVDQWAAEAVLALKHHYPELTLTVVIPFRGQDERYTPDQKRRYNAVLLQADHSIVLQDQYSDDCFFRRNDYLIEHADVLIAVYDQTGFGRSGTGYTVRRAIKQEINIVFIHPKTQELSYSVGKKEHP